MAAENDLLKTLEEAVEANLKNEQFGVEELAEAAGMSRSNLHRKLQDLTGQSVSQFIREHRLERALELLQNENLTASEVAHQVGFGSATYFSKSFHEFYGFTPGEAKNRTQESQANFTKGSTRESRRPYIMAAVVVILITVVFIIFSKKGDSGNQEQLKELEKSIAVLPFKNLNADPDNQYFADGVMESIILNLSKVSELNVRSRTSSERFKGMDLSIGDIAQQLDVNYILEGSAQKYGDDIKITVQLIEVQADNHLWSREYTRKFQDVFQLQSDIALSVVQELKSTISPKEVEQIESVLTENTQAYNEYLQGDYLMRKYDKESYSQAIPLLENAIRLDSTFVEPYVRLGNIYSFGGAVWGLYPQEEARSKAIRFLNQALAIRPDHPEALSILASVYFYYDFDFARTDSILNRLLILTGGLDEFRVDFYRKIGELDLSLEAIDKTIKADPLNAVNYPFKANILFLMGRKTEAIKLLDETFDLYEDFFYLRETMWHYYEFGEIEKSEKAYKKLIHKFPFRSPTIIWHEGMYAYHKGQKPEENIMELKNLYEENASGSPAWFIARYYAETGEKEKLFEWLEKSYQHKEIELTWLKMETGFDPYKQDPRYQDLLERMNFPD